MADAATKGLLCEDGDDYQRGRLLWSRGVARLALGETEAVREDAAELCRPEKPLGRVPGLALLALVELAQHHMDEASRLATEGLQLLGRFKRRADLLAAVQFEAAPKTDKTDALRRLKALRVAPRSRKILLSTGFQWSNEITAAFGLDQGTTRGQATRAPQGG